MQGLTWQSRTLEGSDRARVLFPEGRARDLPVIYLPHGQSDDEDDWTSEEKGRLSTILTESCSVRMLVVLPFGGTDKKRGEPSLAEFSCRFKDVTNSVAARFAPDTYRRAILGVSMGGKQALAFVTSEPARGGFSVLGILSGKFQKDKSKDNLEEVRRYANYWSNSLGQELALYFHYCGAGDDQPRPGKEPLRGDKRFLASNETVAKELAEGRIRVEENGLHNWNFWRPQLKKFFEELSDLWRDRAVR